MWPPPQITDPSPAAVAAKPPSEVLKKEALPPNYFQLTLRDSATYTAGLGTVIGQHCSGLYSYSFCVDQSCNNSKRLFNPLMGTLKLQSNGPLYSNMVIAILAVDGWAVTFGTAKRGLGDLQPHPVPSSL